jgi:hypothetical protein
MARRVRLQRDQRQSHAYPLHQYRHASGGPNSATPTTFVVGGGNGTVGANEIRGGRERADAKVPPASRVSRRRAAPSYTIDNKRHHGYCVSATLGAVADFT